MLIKSAVRESRNKLISWRMMILKDYDVERLCFIIKFDFSTIPIHLSHKVVIYICPKCKEEYESPIEMVEKFEEDARNGLPISTSPYTVCPKCHYDKGVPIDYKSKRGYHHKYDKTK